MAVVNLGKLNTATTTYVIDSEDDDAIDPDVTPDGDPVAYGKLIWETCKLFAVPLTGYSIRLRAYAEQIGDRGQLLANVLDEAYQATNGEMCAGG